MRLQEDLRLGLHKVHDEPANHYPADKVDKRDHEQKNNNYRRHNDLLSKLEETTLIQFRKSLVFVGTSSRSGNSIAGP